ncbi:uncharacterized protein EDB91DRAFT_1257008 [Suillus paluster]|uniref:uncharacterized protein n=1 Tax=Suillus paluster TaxID=48578 RepID=UPI001B875FEF|nr:uncharacterized protein EDB91DRAFT_1257008 [Suillus paluster]KAG1720419.1 hypothetical protein EDB91DRAFT_1257008 [Suillus paluster]
MNSSKYYSKKPIVLIVKAKQPADAIEIALERQFSLKKDGDTLSLSIGQESVTVPTQCHDSLRLLIHHHDIYRQTSTALLALPHPSPLVPIYFAITFYYCEVLLAFQKEVIDDAPGSDKTWRSAHLDYHFAMALDDHAFNQEKQKATLSKIKRTWADFKRKKGYEPVDQLNIIEYHKRMCKGKDMCGDPSANHRISVSDMIASIVASDIGSTPMVVDAEKVEKNFRINSDQEEDDIDEAANISEIQADGRKERRQTKVGRREKGAHGRVEATTDSVEGRTNRSSRKIITRGKGKAIVESGGQDDTHKYATRSTPDMVRAAHTKGKEKESIESGHEYDRGDTMSDMDGIDEGAQATPGIPRLMGVRAPSAAESGTLRGVDEEGAGDYEDADLPSTFEDWENWNRIAFQNGNSHIFLKLGTWILLRFRQLANTPIDGDLDGLLIPDHPAQFDIEDNADFQEALGMTRLYSALAHIDTNPEYLVHIFHEIGKASSEERLGSSHPGIRPLPELPAPIKSMILNDQPPWLKTFPLDHEVHDDEQDDQHAEDHVDDYGGGVSGALNEMVISGAQEPGDISEWQDTQARKRPLSSTLYLQKREGRHAFAKRTKSSTAKSFIHPSSPVVPPIAPHATATSKVIIVPTTEPSRMETVIVAPPSIAFGSHIIHDYDMNAVSDSMHKRSQDNTSEPSEIGLASESEKDSDMQISSASEVHEAVEQIDDYEEASSASDIISMEDDGAGESDSPQKPTNNVRKTREGTARPEL